MTYADTIIIGGGPGGYELAAALASRGENVVIAERDRLGGTCLNRGCIPTKALCASANAVLSARFAAALGVETEGVRIDFSRVSSRVKEVVDGLREGVGGLLSGCTVVNGEATFVGPNRIRIGEEEYEAPRIVIATGSAPAALNIPGASLSITSDDALWLESLPESMVIIGGGVIGMEFASIFSALGTKVTVVEFCREILPTVDPEIAKRLRTTLSRRGIDIVVGAAVQRIERGDGAVLVTYEGKKGETTVEAEKVVMAVGRRAVVPEGFVENGGRLTDRGFIAVDAGGSMRTSIPGVYAVGDVNGLMMLAHSAYAQGRVLLYNDVHQFEPWRIPSVVFTSPEVASVGMTPGELEKNGIKYHAVKRPFASNGKACADGHPDGLVKLLCLDEDDTIVGITILGHHAASLIAEATVFVSDRVKLHEVARRYTFAHPTLAEIFN